LAGFLRQVPPTVPALLRQQHLDGIHFGCGNQCPMMSGVTGLASGLPFALVLAATRSLLAGQSVRRRWFGGIRGVPLAQGQLPLQIRNLLLGIRNLLLAFGDLLLALGYFAAQFFVFSLEPFVLPPKLFPAGLSGVPLGIRRCPFWSRAARPCRTHPPYVKRFGEICPAKSAIITKAMQRSPEINPCP
jgi:hypothetical protein